MLAPVDRFLEKVGKPTEKGCWPWMAARASNGYGHFSINGRAMQANRAAYLLFKGEIPPGMYVCHSCDDRECVNPEHLWLGTPKDNVQDMLRKGRHIPSIKKGSKHPHAKLKEADIPEIRKCLAEGNTQRATAAKFNISQRQIWSIAHRKHWAHQ